MPSGASTPLVASIARTTSPGSSSFFGVNGSIDGGIDGEPAGIDPVRRELAS